MYPICESAPAGHMEGDVKNMTGHRRREIIISIHPGHVAKIFDGSKNYELRKSWPQYIDVPFRCYIYETLPGAGAVVGEFWATCAEATKDHVRLSEAANISMIDTLNYLGCQPGYLWAIENPIKYDKPVDLEAFDLERPPQSWQYIY